VKGSLNGSSLFGILYMQMLLISHHFLDFEANGEIAIDLCSEHKRF